MSAPGLGGFACSRRTQRQRQPYATCSRDDSSREPQDDSGPIPNRANEVIAPDNGWQDYKKNRSTPVPKARNEARTNKVK